MKQIDLHTYGKTPACIYLAFQLSQLGDQRLASKVGQALTHFRELVGALERSNEAGIMATNQVSAFASRLKPTTDHYHDKFAVKSEIIGNLVRNIMVGELKSLLRRCSQAKHRFKDIQRNLADAPPATMGNLMRQLRPRVSDFEDTITPDTLLQKSLAKLERKGKISTLY